MNQAAVATSTLGLSLIREREYWVYPNVKRASQQREGCIKGWLKDANYMNRKMWIKCCEFDDTDDNIMTMNVEFPELFEKELNSAIT